MNEQKNIYPNQLNIIINTNIPTISKIKYKPSMTIKDTNYQNVLFNHLVKLNYYFQTNRKDCFSKILLQKMNRLDLLRLNEKI
jgi:hypothetical protein